MWPFISKPKIEEISSNNDRTSFRCATANILEEVEWGEDKEIRRGTKHFRGGAKVYIIDTYPGMCESAVTIGHHRASGRYITLSLRVHFLENFRITTVYSPKVIALTDKYWIKKGKSFRYAEGQAEHFLVSAEGWASEERTKRSRATR